MVAYQTIYKFNKDGLVGYHNYEGFKMK